MGQEQRDWELEELAEERRASEIAKRMLKRQKMTLEEIAEDAGLELKEVKKLAEEMAKEKQA